MTANNTKNLSFRIEKQTNQKIKYFVYKSKKYAINFNLLKNNCNYFYQNRKQFKDIECIDLVNEEEANVIFSEESIQAFISNCQNEDCKIGLSSVISLNYLANKYDYPALKKYTDNIIKENSKDLIFQKILFKIDESNDEQFISNHLSQYIEDDQIFQLPLTNIDRIIQFYKRNPSIEKVDSTALMNFLFRCLDHYGKDASILFNDIDFKEQNIGFVNRLITDYSEKFDFNMINSTLAKTTTDLSNELSKQNQRHSLIFNQMKKKYDQQVKELTKMKNDAEMKLKEEEKRNQLQIKEYKDEIENIKNQMENRIKSIENKFEFICNQYQSTIQNGRIQKYHNVLLELINYDSFINLTEDSKKHIINEIIENQIEEKDNILFKKISCCKNLFDFLSEKNRINVKPLYKSDRSFLIEFIIDKMKKMNLNANEIECLFKKELLSKSLISILDNFESLFIEVNNEMNDIDSISNIIYDVKAKKDANSNRIVLPLNIKNNDQFQKIDKLNNAVNFVCIESTVNEIADRSFLNFTKLTKIEFNSKVRKIGNSSFEGCTSLAEITIPSSVKSIGSHAFKKCTSLTKIVIPTSVESIKSNAFEGCTSLTNIQIPTSIKSIGSNVFEGCTSLTNIQIPTTVTSIESNAFKGCTSLTNIQIPTSIKSIGSNAFEGCTSLTNIQIPTSVTSIESNAFKGCTSLTNISIPTSVKSIGNNIFNGINKITLCKDMTTIPNNLFKGCTSLTEIIIPTSINSIESNVFEGCTSLTNIQIPTSVTSIAKNAFNGCSASIIRTFDYVRGKEMTGVFRYLTSQTKGNIHDNGTISISASSNDNGNGNNNLQPKNLCNFDDLSTNSWWYPNNEKNATLLFDFKQRKIKLTHYTLHTPSNGGSCFPKSWTLECSNDNKQWIPKDNRVNESVMNNQNVCHTFKCQAQSDEFYQYVRIKTDISWSNNYYFDISAVEMFGCLEEK